MSGSIFSFNKVTTSWYCGGVQVFWSNKINCHPKIFLLPPPQILFHILICVYIWNPNPAQTFAPPPISSGVCLRTNIHHDSLSYRQFIGSLPLIKLQIIFTIFDSQYLCKSSQKIELSVSAMEKASTWPFAATAWSAFCNKAHSIISSSPPISLSYSITKLFISSYTNTITTFHLS